MSDQSKPKISMEEKLTIMLIAKDFTIKYMGQGFTSLKSEEFAKKVTAIYLEVYKEILTNLG